MTLQDFINTKTAKYTSTTIEYKGYTFRASINYSEHNIWDETGNKAVYNWKGELPISMAKLEQLLDWTMNCIDYCNDCLEKIEGRTHYLWAGAYCDKCWAKNKAEDRDFGNYGRLD